MGRYEAEDRLAMFFTDEQWNIMGDIAEVLDKEAVVSVLKV